MNKLERLAINSLNHAVKNFDEKSHILKAAKILEKLVVCAPSGMAPHKVQYKIAEEAGMEPSTTTIYSAGLGLVIGFSRYSLGDSFEHLNILNLPNFITDNAGTLLKYWGIYSFIDAYIRLSYSNLFNKPLGTFLWEASYLAKEKLINPLLKKLDDGIDDIIDV